MKMLLSLSIVFVLSACSNKEKAQEPATAPKATSAEKKATTPKTLEKSKSSQSTYGQTVTCTLNKDVRVIDVRSNGEGCEVFYKKLDQESSIGNANSGTEHCKQIQQRVAKNLSTAGFSCE